MVILASRKSALGWVNNAADSQSLPSFDVITRSAPSGETWAVPSRKTQNQLLLNRTRSVNALCGARSQIFRTSTTSPFPSSAPASDLASKSIRAMQKIFHDHVERGWDRGRCGEQ